MTERELMELKEHSGNHNCDSAGNHTQEQNSNEAKWKWGKKHVRKPSCLSWGFLTLVKSSMPSFWAAVQVEALNLESHIRLISIFLINNSVILSALYDTHYLILYQVVLVVHHIFSCSCCIFPTLKSYLSSFFHSSLWCLVSVTQIICSSHSRKLSWLFLPLFVFHVHNISFPLVFYLYLLYYWLSYLCLLYY